MIKIIKDIGILAEREGFEPPIPVKVYSLSRRAPSTTRPSLRGTPGQAWLSAGAFLNCQEQVSSVSV